jgi:capsular exopolysaccharide synthesis family protein
MSRFYRALQEAGRIGPELVEKTAGQEVETPNAGGDPLPPLDYSEVMQAIAPLAPPAKTPVEEPASEAPVTASPVAAARSATASSAVELGVPANVVLDRAARLLPHAADESIVEYYRRLRAKIIQEQERKPFRSLVITSPAPQDGKSVTTLNLALSFGMLPGYRVLVVDGDLRRGSLGSWLGVGDHPGLGNLLEGSAELEDVVLKCDDIPVHFMVRGSATTAPAELLHSSRLGPQLRRMTEYFSLVLVDSPPVNLVADAQLLAAGCDAVLLVARAFSTTRKSLERAVQDLSSFRVIGTVLNRGMRADLYRHYKSYK